MGIHKPTTMCMMRKIRQKFYEAFVLNTSTPSINQNLILTIKNDKDYV